MRSMRRCSSGNKVAWLLPATPQRHDKDGSVLPDHQDAGEFLDGVIRHVGHDPWRYRDSGTGRQNGLAVRLCAHDGANRNGAARTAAIFDHDRLAELDRERLEYRAVDQIGGATRRERNEGPWRLRRHAGQQTEDIRAQAAIN
jgi:hypothetical protein